MPVASLTICEWRGVSKHDREVTSPSWVDVEAAIRALDGNAFNDVYLQPDADDEETYLCVGGGYNGYIASGAIRNEQFPVWVDRARPDEPQVIITVGGQSGYYPNN